MRKVLLILLACLLIAGAASATIAGRRVTVASTATVLATNTNTFNGPTNQELFINQDSSLSVYLGGSGVTSATGAELKAGASVSVPLAPGESVYGIVASTSVRVDVVESQR